VIKVIIEIKIDYDKCVKCKQCVKACSFGVLEWIDDMPVVVSPENCKFCLECAKNCLVNAITHKEK
jgi:NAD-dependent dihydropyrimidine dehydrogenase PreA subunit